MAFSSLIFIFVFLPLALVLYYIFPKNLRNIPLVAASALFYAWASPAYLVLLLLCTAFGYVSGLEIASLRNAGQTRGAKTALTAAVAFHVLLLVFYKYAGLLTAKSIALPLGISFYTFSMLSYLFDVYRGSAPAAKNPLDYASFVLFFPKLISGPIVQYKDMARQLKRRPMNMTRFCAGLALFLTGLYKKVLISDRLGAAFAPIRALDQMSVGTAWMGMALYSLQLYFDFSGYSDMAIGIAAMFGFRFEKNFNYPYRSVSMTDFWRRWHISLGAWFRDYVYIPLGGSRVQEPLVLRNLVIVWVLTGLWHGSTLNFLAWGLFHLAFLLLEKYVLKDFLPRIPEAVRVVLSTLIAFFGWVWFFPSSLREALHYFGQMFGKGHLGLFDSGFAWHFGSCWLILLIAFVGSGPLVSRLLEKHVYKKGGKTVVVSVCVHAVLLALTVAVLVSQTYTSFLYFQF